MGLPEIRVEWLDLAKHGEEFTTQTGSIEWKRRFVKTEVESGKIEHRERWRKKKEFS